MSGMLGIPNDGLRHLFFHKVGEADEKASVCASPNTLLEADSIEDCTCRRCLSLAMQYHKAHRHWHGLERCRDRLDELGGTQQ